jgi:hypothetical protein
MVFERTCVGLVVVLSMIFLWWWLGLGVALVAFFILPNYKEIVVWGALIDLLYGYPEFIGMPFPWFFTILTAFLALAEPIKRNITFYDRV